MKQGFKNIETKEVLYQIMFLLALFFLYSFDKYSPKIELHKIIFFLHYVSVAMLISYSFLPLFFYTKKYLKLCIISIFILAYLYIMEEFVLEKIFFTNKRAEHVSNVFFTLLDIVPMVLAMVSFKLAWDANKKQREVERLQSSVQESELRFLKSQINPHFLFNNLNNLYSYAIENSPKTPSIILELSTVLRYMLYDCKEDYVPLYKEIEHLKHFTALNELQIENRGTVTFSTNRITNNFEIAPLILMVFIENAFKHSTASQSNNIIIDISIDITDEGTLHFKCKNSFLPNANNQSLTKGIGLKNVKKRLSLLYPNKHNLQITDVDNIYDINLTLELQPK